MRELTFDSCILKTEALEKGFEQCRAAVRELIFDLCLLRWRRLHLPPPIHPGLPLCGQNLLFEDCRCSHTYNDYDDGYKSAGVILSLSSYLYLLCHNMTIVIDQASIGKVQRCSRPPTKLGAKR